MIRLYSIYKDKIATLTNSVPNNAQGVTYSQANRAYRIAMIEHLPGDINRGNHHAFVDVLWTNGQPLTVLPLRIGWTWNGRHSDEDAPPQALDKGPLDWANGNVQINKGQVMSLWLEDNSGKVVSDVVSGLRTDISADDPATGNSLFHHSFYLVFMANAVIPVTQPTLTIEERIVRIEKFLGL